jgi:hypothetical protein
VLRSLLPAAVAHGVTTEEKAGRALAAMARDAAGNADLPMLWPLMAGIWKRKP